MSDFGNAQKNELGLMSKKNKYDLNDSVFNVESKNDSHAFIAQEIIKQNKQTMVLDIGCGSGILANFFLDYPNIKIDGVEVDKDAIKKAEKLKRYDNLFNKSIEKFLEDKTSKKYDYIVLGDVLEHLVEPYKVLDMIDSLLTKDGSILVSVPNVSNIDIIKGIINDKFNYNDVGSLDTTHLRFFTLKSFAEMVSNINQHRNKKYDLTLLNVTHFIPDDIDSNSDLYKLLNMNKSSSVFQLIFKLDIDNSLINLNKILDLKEIDIYKQLAKVVYEKNDLVKRNDELVIENMDLVDTASVLLKEKRFVIDDYNKILYSRSWKFIRFFKRFFNLFDRTIRKLFRAKTKLKVLLENDKDIVDYESKSSRENIDDVISKLSKYDIVSFDIFDTLIFRSFVNPTDLFRSIETDYKVYGFFNNRVIAEKEARRITKKKNFEINIDDIYKALNKNLNYKKIDLKKLEFEYECKACYANSFMLEVVNKLQKLGKKIVITSDMYWPKEYLNKLLKNCGYDNLNDIYVSCDYEINKGTGELQKLIGGKYKNNSFIHIGDNYLSDIMGSKKAGWHTYYYKSCKDIAKEIDDPIYDDSLENSFSSAIRFNYLYNGSNRENMYFNYGFKYGGLLTCGFLEHINKICNDKKIDKVLFLARDSKIFYDVYNKYYKKCDNEYVITSRSAMYEACFDSNVGDFIEFYFYSRSKIGKSTIEESLIQTDLRVLLPFVSDYNLCLTDLLNGNNYEEFCRLIYDKKEVISDYFRPSKEACKKYLESVIGDNKYLLAVDLGWSGTIISLMRSFIKENISDDISLLATFIGNKDSRLVNNLVDQQIFIPYCFSYCYNYIDLINVGTIKGSSNAMILESMFTSNDFSLLKYEKDFVYSQFTTNNKNLIEIHRGIMEYVRVYNEFNFSTDKCSCVDSLTAFRPVLNVLVKPKINYMIFKNFKEYNDSLPRFEGEKSITTVGKIMKDRNII